MSSSERPIGTAKGKQPNTEALCQRPPPPPQHTQQRAQYTPCHRKRCARTPAVPKPKPRERSSPRRALGMWANKIGQNCWLDTGVVVVV